MVIGYPDPSVDKVYLFWNLDRTDDKLFGYV